jgi:hypothetical protein
MAVRQIKWDRAAPIMPLATNGVSAGKAVMDIWCNRLEQLIIVVVVDIIEASSN